MKRSLDLDRPAARKLAYTSMGLLLAGLWGILLSGAFALLSLHARGEQLLAVQTASMRPTFQPGDALIVRPVKATDLRVGEIISYQSRSPGVIITHRLVAINRQTGLLTTAGDSLRSPDLAFPPDQVIGRATALAPKLGLVLDFLRHPLGLALAIYVPGALIIGFEVTQLTQTYTRPVYSARL